MLVPLALLHACWRRRGFALPLSAAIVMALWFAAAAAFASSGAFQTTLDGVPTVAFALAVPIALGLGASWLIRPMRAAFESPDLQPMLIAMQSYRIAGLGFTLLMAVGQLPACSRSQLD